jgi:adenine nucleotide transporter 17
MLRPGRGGGGARARTREELAWDVFFFTVRPSSFVVISLSLSPHYVASTQLAEKGTKLVDVAKGIYDSNGLQGFFTGIYASAVLCINPAIQFACYESGKTRILDAFATKSLTSAQAFFLGAFAKAVATLITYPFVRVKILLQGNKDCEGKSMTEVFKDLYNMGIAEIYKGLWPQLTRGVLGAALMFFAKEKIENVVKGMLRKESPIKGAHLYG